MTSTERGELRIMGVIKEKMVRYILRSDGGKLREFR